MNNKYSIYDFPELLYNSKLFTNRQRCIILCLFSFLNLKGGGAFTIDILAERTGIRKEHIYRELKALTYIKEENGVKKEVSIIKREGKKISLDIEKLREFISAKLASSSSAKTAPNNCQNGTKKLPKQHLDSAKLAVSKCQNGTKKSPEAQGSQSPDGSVNNISRKDFLDKNSQKKVLDKQTENNSAPPQNSGSDSEEGKKIDRGIVERLAEEVIREFKLEFKRRYNRYPIVSNKSRKLLVENLSGAQNLEELQDTVKTLIENIPRYFTMNDTWVKKQGYSFFAFCHRLEELTALPDRTIHVNFGWSREEKVGEAALW